MDAMGNRTAEQVFAPANTLAQSRSRVFSSLNRLFQELGSLNQTTEYGYDNQGNVTSVKDPLNRVTSNQYDALNRLKQVTDPGLGVRSTGTTASTPSFRCRIRVPWSPATPWMALAISRRRPARTRATPLMSTMPPAMSLRGPTPRDRRRRTPTTH